jgi:lysozyme family protein
MYFNLPPTWFLWIWFGVTIAALILEMVLFTKSYLNMADFEKAIPFILENEGYLSNNPDDHGKLTYRGIASAYWPNWEGWPIVNEAIANGTTSSLKSNSELEGMVDKFYKANFWDVNKLDQFTDQSIARNVMDFGVNSGTGRSAKTLQQILELPQDGIIGTVTLGQVNGCDFEATYNAYNNWRKSFYENLAQKPGQAQFLHSWLSRLVPYGE